MLLKYRSHYGQSIYDICLMTYGTLELLFKLMLDNDFGSIDNDPFVGQEFVYDDTLIFDEKVVVSNSISGIIYCTSSVSSRGQYYSIDDQNQLPIGIGGHEPVSDDVYDGLLDDLNNDDNMYYDDL